MAAVDYTNLTRAIIKHMADNTESALDVGGPEPFDPSDKPYWCVLSVTAVSDSPSRELPRRGALTVLATCRVALHSNLYTVTTYASEIAEHLNRAYISVYDYEADEENGLLVGHIQMKEPKISRINLAQTWQEMTVTVAGTWQLDTGSTLQSLPRV